MTAVWLVVSFLFVAAAGWLRAASTAVSHVPRGDAVRDASEGRRGAQRIADLTEERQVISPAVGMVTTALLLLGTVIATAVLASDASPLSPVVSAVIAAVAGFALGDLVPRRLGRASPKPIAYGSARYLAIAVRVGSSAYDLSPEGEEGEDTGSFGAPAEDDDEQERELIDSVLEFGETVVREVMTPRPDMVTVSIEAPIEDVIATATDEGYSRLPVIHGGEVAGILIVKDLLPLLAEGHRPRVGDVMRPAEFIPESKLASALLAEMQESRTHLVIVVDEYGEVAGLVTIEDLLEELVGEITDETDEEEEFVVARGERIWEVDGRLPVEDLADLAGVELPDEDWDTVGGLILGLAERVPEEGETFAYEGLELTVTRMQGRRVSAVEVAGPGSREG